MAQKNFNILIADDEKDYLEVLRAILEDQGYSVLTAENGAEGLEMARNNRVDLVITDLRMPVMTGEELIHSLRAEGMEMDIIVSTAYGTIESAVDAIREGANDYFVKTGEMDELLLKVDRTARMKRLENKSDILLKNMNGQKVCLDSGNSKFNEVLDICRRTADTGINILIKGESGVGKEVLANYIHSMSDRAEEPFIPVNCQVFPEGVIESELFGHEKGAFTGAIESRVGKFEEANYGTLFLDEIGDLPLTTQGKLLRAIETKSIERLGSNRRIDLDVRFIFATNKDLVKGIEEGTFREDLYYRINTLTVDIPALRDRKEDLPGLIDFFVERTSADQKKGKVSIEEAVIEKMLEYDYPGNVRELKNMIERMIALSRDGRVTMAEYTTPAGASQNVYESFGDQRDLRMARSEFEKRFIEGALKKNDWNVTRCAEILGITPRQLWNKIGQYDLKKE